MKASNIRDELKHIRLIHFTLTTLSGLMLYLIVAAWSVPPQVYPELLDLKDFLSRLQTGDVQLREIDPRAATEAESRILQRLQALINPKLRWGTPGKPYLPSFTCMPPATTAEVQKNNLSQMIDQAVKAPCKLMMPEQIDANAAEARQWIDEGTSDRFTMPNRIVTGPYIIGFTAGTGFGAAGSSGKLTLAINYTVIAGGDIPAGHTWTAERDFELTATPQPNSYNLPNDWLTRRFPVIAAHLDVLGNKSIDDALTWARDQRTEGISSLKLSLLGVEVKSAHIGGVGPLVITAMLLYMLAYLQHWVTIMPENAKTGQESVRSVSPWLGAQGLLGLAITAATVACLPAAVTALSVYRLVGWPLPLSTMLGLLTFSIGALCVRNGHQLTQRKIEIS